MRVNIRGILLLVVIISGCTSAPKAITQPTEVPSGPSVIYVGMSLETAQAKLKEYHAEQSWNQFGLGAESLRMGMTLDKYQLPTGIVVNLTSMPGKTGRIVADILVSTYVPQSWDPQSNPEYLRSIRSFKKRKAFDLTTRPPSNELPWPGSRMRH